MPQGRLAHGLLQTCHAAEVPYHSALQRRVRGGDRQGGEGAEIQVMIKDASGVVPNALSQAIRQFLPV